MQTTVIYSDGENLKTNRILREWLGNQKELIAILEGDNLIIKKSPSLLDFASESNGDLLSLEEISEEVHKTR